MIATAPEDRDVGADGDADFERFVAAVEPRLRRALVAMAGAERTHDAVAEALAWAWEHWSQVESMTNPAGYLYRVARTHLRVRRPSRVRYLITEDARLPQIEPGLPAALAALPRRQQEVVWLVYACEWSYAEVADALDISASAVGTHAARGLASLRNSIGEVDG